jgi:hypothetical protein
MRGGERDLEGAKARRSDARLLGDVAVGEGTCRCYGVVTRRAEYGVRVGLESRSGRWALGEGRAGEGVVSTRSSERAARSPFMISFMPAPSLCGGMDRGIERDLALGVHVIIHVTTKSI